MVLFLRKPERIRKTRLDAVNPHAHADMGSLRCPREESKEFSVLSVLLLVSEEQASTQQKPGEGKQGTSHFFSCLFKKKIKKNIKPLL